MEKPEQLQSSVPYAPASADAVGRVRVRVRVAGGRGLAAVGALWRHRALIVGMAAVALAVSGEQLMRALPAVGGAQASPGASNAGAEWGAHLVQVAALLVGLVAWVSDGVRLRRSRAAVGAQVDSVAVPAASSLPVRAKRATASLSAKADTRLGVGKAQVKLTPAMRARWLANRYTEVRARAGWLGTAVGLAVVGGLAVWMYFLLSQDFSSPLAPWVWAAILAALVLTFAGVRPWPRGRTLLTHDPAEPADEPPVSRAEWAAVGVVMLAAVLLRVWNLDSIPAGPYIDESGRALDARAINTSGLFNHGQFIFFGTGWWGVPSLYFWLEAQSFKLFGDNLLGARVIHAIAGIGAVWYTYRVGRVAWSPRVGLVAGALVAGSDFAIQFSRTAGESTITLFTWVVCFYYLYKGLKTRRPLDFVLSGLAGGFTLYGYAPGKLLPVCLALIAVYLLVRWRMAGIKRYALGFVLLALAAGLTFLPNGLFILTQKPGALTERSQGVAIFSPPNHDALVKQYGSDNWGVIVASQFGLTYSALDVGQEKGPFYPTGEPILPVPWAALWVLGTAYMIWRVGDARYGVLAGWLVAGLAGAALTNDTPTLQRVVGMVPTLGLIPVLYLDRVASGVALRMPRKRLAWPRRARALRWVTNVGLAALVVALASQTVQFYFGAYTPRQHYVQYTLAGRYIEKLDPRHDVVYASELPVMFGDSSPLLFLAKDMPQNDLGNLSDELPVVSNRGKNVNFLIGDPTREYVSAVEAYYPGGSKTQTNGPDGTPLFTAYRVSGQQVDEQRQVMARYGPAGGPLFERPEARLGTFGPADGEAITPPSWITYPTTAEWLGGLVAPAYGAYRLSLNAPKGGSLEIDGRKLITATVGSTAGTEAHVVLAKGVHEVRLGGVLESALGQVELQWGADNGELAPVGRQFLWSGPQGTLMAESYAVARDDAWFTAPQIPANGMPPKLARRDGLLAWRSINGALGAGPLIFGVWKGTLNAPADGDYVLDAVGNGRMSLWVDGEIEGARDVGSKLPPFPATVTLKAGRHPLEVRFAAKQENAQFELYWQPPGGERQLLPPTALTPAEGGAWPASERPGAPSPDGSIFGEVSGVSVQVAETIAGGDNWKNPLGLGVLPDGRLAVGDSGHHRLLIYGPDGRQTASWSGSGADAFNEISDLAVAADGTIAVLDAENGDIRLFNEDAQPTGHLPREKLGLTHPRGIAWGPDDKIYVADTAGGRIARFSREGAHEADYRDGAGSLLPLEQPIDVTVAGDGAVYGVDLRGRVVRFSATGQMEREWKAVVGVSRGGSHLAIWGNQIAMTNPDAGDVTLIDPAKGATVKLNIGDGSLTLLGPTGIASGTGDKLYVLDSGNSRVVVLEGK